MTACADIAKYPREPSTLAVTVLFVARDADPWFLDEFQASLTSVSAATLRAYRSDIDQFV